MALVVILLVIVGSPFIVALFIKKEYSVESEIKVDRPNPVVFDYLRLLKNHETFSKWDKTDPRMSKHYRGSDGTVGFIMTWESRNKQVGKGEQEIKKIIFGKRIDYEMRFFQPFNGVAHAYMTMDAMSRNETIVIWGIEGRMNYPMNLLLLFNVKKKMGKDLTSGLNSLKQLLEKQEFVGRSRSQG